ncbi:MAG: hypothetical protein ACW99F_19455 [Candidatus Hodarchaeales archaeon]|jgi:hypothetical protein
MSKVFYDHLLSLDGLKKEIDLVSESLEEKEELWQLVDEIIHYRILHIILDNLDDKHHPEFVEFYHKCPHDETILVFIKEKMGDKYERIVKAEANNMSSEIMKLIESD